MMHAIGYGYATDMWGEANIIFGERVQGGQRPPWPPEACDD